MRFAIGSTVIFFKFYAIKLVCADVHFYFPRLVLLKHFGCIFEGCYMVDSRSARYGIILVCTGSLHSDVSLVFLPTFGIT